MWPFESENTVNASSNRFGGCLRLLAWAGAGLLSGFWTANCYAQESARALTAEQIVAEMTKRNQERSEALRGYTSLRTYRCEYHGFGDREAELVVKMSYMSPDKKDFTILSESGSGILRKHVLRKLLEAEQEAASEENRRSTAMRRDNYEFELAGMERNADGDLYVLELKPKKRNKFLFRGRIWVDSKDFAVVRMEGEPANNPSWWTKKISIDVRYRKVRDFWLLANNHTLTEVRFHGRAVTTIDYADYRLTEGEGSPATRPNPTGTSSSCAAGAAEHSCVRDR
jgi:hypothetical protein